MSNSSLSIVVVGAGVYGITAAIELRARGWRVAVIDPGPLPRPAAASTDISKVVRMDYGADEIYTVMAEEALARWDRWNAAWTRPLYHEDGFLLLTREAMQPGSFEYESFALLRHRGHALERLMPKDIEVRFPQWRTGQYRDGYLNPRAGWVESGNVLAWLVREAAARGVEIIEDASFAGLIEMDSRVAGVRTSAGDDLGADVVLAAAGAWTPALFPHLRDVMRTIGQPVVHFQVSRPAEWQPPGFRVWASDISLTGWYGFPALDNGILKIGRHGPGRLVHPDEPRDVRPSEIAGFREFLRESLPALEDAPIAATRLCLYCDTFDGDFWIDRDAGRPGLFVAAGDSGHGFKFAPVLGGLIADVVEGRSNPWAHRFAARPLTTGRKEAARAILQSADFG